LSKDEIQAPPAVPSSSVAEIIPENLIYEKEKKPGHPKMRASCAILHRLPSLETACCVTSRASAKLPAWLVEKNRVGASQNGVQQAGFDYYTGLFKTRAEAEEEIKQRMTLPEKAGYRMHATELPEDRAKQPRRTSSRRSGRR